MTVPEQSKTQPPMAEDALSLSKKRRKLLTGGAATSILMTVASRPAWAAGSQCTPSALASANLSGEDGFEGCGISAGWWKNKTNRWPISSSTAFHSIFGAVRYNNVVLFKNTNGTDLTLAQVINFSASNAPTNPKNIAMHLVGAYLNALQFPNLYGNAGYAYSAQAVVNMFNSLDNAALSAFDTVKTTLETANDQFDSSTPKP